LPCVNFAGLGSLPEAGLGNELYRF
jgi:hypothetical protein